MAPGSTYDSAKANGFAERLLTTLNDGALCLMISIGHRTGLLDAMRDAAPATSAEIAAKAGLNERYVREWLGAMVTGRIVDVDPATNRFPCRRSTQRFSPAAPAQITSACSPSTSHCSAALRTISSNVSKKAAACLTLSFRVFTK